MRDFSYEDINKWLAAGGAQASVLLKTAAGASGLGELIDKVQQSNNCEQLIKLSTEKKSISIEAIRSLGSQVYRTTATGRRVIHIPDAHKLSLPAANALLKILEEPPESARFLLTTPWPGRLPATIRSRCQLAYLKGEAKEKILKEERFDAWGLMIKGDGKGGLSEEELERIERHLNTKLRQEGPVRAVKAGFMRLRDYYRITGSGGNEKAAIDMLLATLAQD